MIINNMLYSLFGNAEGSIDKTAIWTAALALCVSGNPACITLSQARF